MTERKFLSNINLASCHFSVNMIDYLYNHRRKGDVCLKKTLIFTILVLCYAMIAGGCGSDGSGTASNKSLGFTETENDSESQSDSYSSAGEAAEGVTDEASSNTANQNAEENATNNTSTTVNTDMLVYTCNLSIDTLDYEKSVTDFRNMLSSVGGFVEKENYTDGLSNTSYYIEETDKHKVYSATVRVPHDKYDTFVNGAGALGDVRSKSSNVENVNQEYTDLNTTLQIYEAKEKRYIKMLAEITDDKHAVTVEKELTEIQVKIAGIKTRLKEIKTDVDFSTVDIQIREVSKYDEKPAKTDTFLQRLGNTLKTTGKNFLSFLETMLFLLIRMAPYILLLGIILYVIYKIQKRVQKQKTANTPHALQNPPDDADVPADTQAEETAAAPSEMVHFENNEEEK